MNDTLIARTGKAAAILCLFGLIFFSAIQPAGAEQQGSEVLIIKTDGAELRGELIAVHDQTLIVRADGTHLAIRLDRISRLTVRRDSKSREWMEYGALIGEEAGVWDAIASGQDGHGDAILSVIALGALGALIGAGLGALDGLDEHYSMENITTTKQKAELLRHLSGLARFRSDK